jgi:histidinol-phosphate phosphatase family protein
MANKAVFLDRDGIINEDPKPALYVRKWKEFRFIPGVAGAISKLNHNGFKVLIVSNQSGIARGLVKPLDLKRITLNMQKSLMAKGARIDGVYYCPHDNGDHCPCRKPRAGLFKKAAIEHGIDVKSSYNIGDMPRDIEAGKKVGLKSIMVLSAKGFLNNVSSSRRPHSITVNTLTEAVDWIIQRQS